MLILSFQSLSLLIIDAYPFGGIVEDVAELRQSINEVLASGDEIVVIECMFPDADDSNVSERANLWLTHMELSFDEPVPFVSNPAPAPNAGPVKIFDAIVRGGNSLEDVDLRGW